MSQELAPLRPGPHRTPRRTRRRPPRRRLDPRRAELNTENVVARLVAVHRTTVLKSSSGQPNAAKVTPLQALQQYYTYAQDQLAAAVRPSREASQALAALGKLYVEMDLEPAH